MPWYRMDEDYEEVFLRRRIDKMLLAKDPPLPGQAPLAPPKVVRRRIKPKPKPKPVKKRQAWPVSDANLGDDDGIDFAEWKDEDEEEVVEL